jgi:hypothetical protein
MIYQMHPKHGRCMPTTLIEAQANEKEGWTTVTEKEFYASEKVTQETSQVTSENVPHGTAQEEQQNATEGEHIPRVILEELFEAKFGKKPHHRMKDETIKEKLDAGNP